MSCAVRAAIIGERFTGPAAARARASTNATTSSIFLVGRGGIRQRFGGARQRRGARLRNGERRRIVGRTMGVDLCDGLFLIDLRPAVRNLRRSDVLIGPGRLGFFRLGGRDLLRRLRLRPWWLIGRSRFGRTDRASVGLGTHLPGFHVPTSPTSPPSRRPRASDVASPRPRRSVGRRRGFVSGGSW